MNKEIIKEFREKLEKIEEDYTCIEYNAICRTGLVIKINAIENIARNALKANQEDQRKECQKHIDAEGTIAFQLYKRKLEKTKQDLLKQIEGMKKKCEIIDIVGKKPVKEYFCETYNQALEDIKKLIK